MQIPPSKPLPKDRHVDSLEVARSRLYEIHADGPGQRGIHALPARRVSSGRFFAPKNPDSPRRKFRSSPYSQPAEEDLESRQETAEQIPSGVSVQAFKDGRRGIAMRPIQVELLGKAMNASCYSCGQGLAGGAEVPAGEGPHSRRLELCADCAGRLRDELARVLGETSPSGGERAGG